MNDTLSDDRLEGAAAIAAFWGGSLRQTFHLLETGQLPAGKIGSKWIASKSALREHYAKLTRGEA
jgi:hypothetical protein